MLSIRARLIVLALLAIAPLMIERVHGLEQARAIRTERANNDVIELARRGAESQRQIIYSVRSLLQIVSRVAKMPLDSSTCNRHLADLMTNIPWIRDLSIASDDGRIKCSTQPLALGLNVSDRSHFQSVVTSREFALSDYMISRANDVPSVVASYPIVKDDGALGGVVMAVINLQWIGDLAATAAQHSGAAVLLLDSAGTLVAGSADQPAYIGKRFAGSELARDMLANDSGTVTVADLDGIQRIFAYVRVPWTQARLAVGLDESAVHAGIDHEIGVAYLQLIAFGLFVLLIAWFGGEQLVVRPIRSLVRTATRFAAATSTSAPRKSLGSPNSHRLPQPSTTWRPSLPRAKKNCRSPIVISTNSRASANSAGLPTGAASTARSSANGRRPPRATSHWR
jgi:hypothetical protein